MSGVRRSKVCQLAGRKTIRAMVYHRNGHLLRVADLDIDELVSPKDVIDLTLRVRHKLQFEQMERAAAMGAQFPAIEVFEGGHGTLIRDVRILR